MRCVAVQHCRFLLTRYLLHRELNQSLIENQKQWKVRVDKAENSIAATKDEMDRRVVDLEAQVCHVVHHGLISDEKSQPRYNLGSRFNVLFGYSKYH